MDVLVAMLPTEHAVEAYCISIGLPALGPHLPLILSSFALFFVLQLISTVTAPVVFPNAYSRLDRKGQVNWDMHFVSHPLT